MVERYRLPPGRGVTPPTGFRSSRPGGATGRRSRHDGSVSENRIETEPHDPGTRADGESPPDATTPIEPGRRRRPDRATIAMLLVLLVGILLVVRGLLVGITGEDRADLPEFVESVTPVPEAVQVPNQSNVFVDLATGFTGVLVIDGVELETVNIDELGDTEVEPGQQVDLPPVTRFEPGNNTLTFTPNESAAISEFEDGVHVAEVVYWRIEDGRQFARSYTWTFNVV